MNTTQTTNGSIIKINNKIINKIVLNMCLIFFTKITACINSHDIYNKNIIINNNFNYNIKKDNLYNNFEDFNIKNKHLYNCNINNCPYIKGFCYFGECICRNGYSDSIYNTNKTYCYYKQYKIKTFLLIEMFGLFGFGHINSERYLFGIFKFLFVWCFSIFAIQFVIAFNNYEVDLKETKIFKKYLSYFILLIPVTLHVYDLYSISSNYYKDGNGVPYVPI